MFPSSRSSVRGAFDQVSGLQTVLLILLISPLPALADKGDFSLGLEYQYVRTGDFDSSVGDIDIGNTDSHVMMLSGDYALTDRWTLSASLPYIKKRHKGALPHDPAVDLTEYPEADQSLIDDGNYHNDWQDIYLSVSYLAKEGRLSLYPFVSLGLPTNDYPFYAHAAVGRNIWHVPIGVAFDFTPYFSDFSFSGDVAYVFTEESLGVDINHWLINLDARYYVTPALAPRVFLSIKHGSNGLNFPDDFDVTALNDEAWYFHDRTIKHNFVNGGIGIDWVLSEKYVLSASALTMLVPDQVNIVDYGLSFGMTWYFSAE
jgi:hypothetical protein